MCLQKGERRGTFLDALAYSHELRHVMLSSAYPFSDSLYSATGCEPAAPVPLLCLDTTPLEGKGSYSSTTRI